MLSRALFPGATTDLLAAVDKTLPEAGGIGTGASGSESETPITRSWLTALTRRAARANNEAA